MTENKSIDTQQNPLGVEPVGKLLRQFAVPSIIAMLVGAHSRPDFYRAEHRRIGKCGDKCGLSPFYKLRGYSSDVRHRSGFRI